MKHLICALLLLTLFISPSLAAPADNTLNVSVAPQQADISFTLKNETYAYVIVSTQLDIIKTLLYDENGQFSLTVPLPSCYDASFLRVEVFDLEGRRQLCFDDKTVAVEQTGAPASGLVKPSKIAGSARDMKITMVEGGFHYSFNCPGRDTLTLRYHTPSETHNLTIYAGENYAYSGFAPLYFSYPDDNIAITVKTLNTGHELYMEYHDTYYEPLPAAEQAAEGRLKGVTVCVDPGHQRKTKIETVRLGPNLSQKITTSYGMAQGVLTARKESIVVLEIGLMLRNALLKEGANVVMTRETQDTFVGMLERADIPNNANADFVLRLHCNFRDNDQVQGIVVYCPYMSSYAAEVAPEDEYRNMGFTLLRAMQATTGQTKGTCTLNNSYVGNNWSKMPSFLVEMGYMSNRTEDQLLSASPVYQQKLVDGMVNGIYELAIMRGLIEAPAAQ